MPSLKTNPDGSPHIHQYVRAVGPNMKKVKNKYCCNHPDCKSFDYKHNLVGKRSLCGVCGIKEIILDRAALKLSRPACPFCQTNQKSKSIQAKVHALADLFGESAGVPQL